MLPPCLRAQAPQYRGADLNHNLTVVYGDDEMHAIAKRMFGGSPDTRVLRLESDDIDVVMTCSLHLRSALGSSLEDFRGETRMRVINWLSALPFARSVEAALNFDAPGLRRFGCEGVAAAMHPMTRHVMMTQHDELDDEDFRRVARLENTWSVDYPGDPIEVSLPSVEHLVLEQPNVTAEAWPRIACIKSKFASTTDLSRARLREVAPYDYSPPPLTGVAELTRGPAGYDRRRAL
jgi:hypothetical protein